MSGLFWASKREKRGAGDIECSRDGTNGGCDVLAGREDVAAVPVKTAGHARLKRQLEMLLLFVRAGECDVSTRTVNGRRWEQRYLGGLSRAMKMQESSWQCFPQVLDFGGR